MKRNDEDMAEFRPDNAQTSWRLPFLPRFTLAVAIFLAGCGIDSAGLFTQAHTATTSSDGGAELPDASASLDAREQPESASATSLADAAEAALADAAYAEAADATGEERTELRSESGATSVLESGVMNGEGGTGDSSMAPSCNPSDCPTVLLYMTADAMMPMGREIAFRVKVFNSSLSTLDLTKVTMRYWFLSKGSHKLAFHCDYAALDCATIAGRFTAMTSPTANADTYVELSFKSGSVPTARDSGEILIRLADENYAVTVDETKDWSFDATKVTYAAWDHITLYGAGALVWGIEPR